jgi:hypothetical protein
MEFYIFLFITAVLFTYVGYNMAAKHITKAVAEVAIATCIDGLIKDEYLKTSGTGDDMIILKWNEWNDDTTD